MKRFTFLTKDVNKDPIGRIVYLEPKFGNLGKPDFVRDGLDFYNIQNIADVFEKISSDSVLFYGPFPFNKAKRITALYLLDLFSSHLFNGSDRVYVTCFGKNYYIGRNVSYHREAQLDTFSISDNHLYLYYMFTFVLGLDARKIKIISLKESENSTSQGIPLVLDVGRLPNFKIEQLQYNAKELFKSLVIASQHNRHSTFIAREAPCIAFMTCIRRLFGEKVVIQCMFRAERGVHKFMHKKLDDNCVDLSGKDANHNYDPELYGM